MWWAVGTEVGRYTESCGIFLPLMRSRGSCASWGQYRLMADSRFRFDAPKGSSFGLRHTIMPGAGKLPHLAPVLTADMSWTPHSGPSRTVDYISRTRYLG